MNWTSSRDGYGVPSVAFHWLMLLMIAAAYATMELKSVFPKGSTHREALAVWHYTLGLSVFPLAWLRLSVRWLGTEPAVAPAPPAWQIAAARIMHWALYVFIVVMPILGWLTLSAKGGPVPFFGYELPALIGKSERLAEALKEVHEALATLGYLMIALHAAAALYHHYVRRDNALRLMLAGG